LETSFYQVDVFSNKLFGGNPLAVFLNGEDFAEYQLQQVAKEMNLSETTFISPPSHPDADFDVRIFTPGKEIPFAGHPTLGTAFVLKHAGLIPSTKNHLLLNFKSGLISVYLQDDGIILMKTPKGKILKTFSNNKEVAESLGLKLSNIDPDLPIQTVTTGFPALLVPITTLESIKEMVIDLVLLKPLLEQEKVDMVYPFTRQTFDQKNSIHARGFAPFIGIPEDPGTGSAASALGFYLHEKNPKEKDLRIEQGYEIKRPSNIFVEIVVAEGRTNEIRVGGRVRLVLKGTLYLK
jgi:trans-2,3-dihydro-3-hydroxyanthranilate isomerase